jgi:hypothetical protein
LHPQQEAFVKAFKAWDGYRMAQALIEIVQELGNIRCLESTKQEVTWVSREFLEVMEGHPATGVLMTISEIPLVLGLEGRVEWSQASMPAKHPTVTLQLALSVLEHPSWHDRWNELGLIADKIAIDRDLVQVPVPLKGEPGYPSNQERPSIHRPSKQFLVPESQTYAFALSIQRQSPKPLFDRYRAGEREQVWQELVELGDKVRAEELLPDAMAVVRETMRRCRENIEHLASRLRTLGYEFKYPAEVFVEPPPNTLEYITDLERHVGPIPLSLCAWYEIVGSVNFVGTLRQGSALIDSAYPDPLVVEPGEYILTYDEDNWYREQYELPIAPDLFHKENVSGGSPYTILLPNSSADGYLENEWHETTFVNCLRKSFQWGGFPGWEQYPTDERPDTLLRELSEGLLPI